MCIVILIIATNNYKYGPHKCVLTQPLVMSSEKRCYAAFGRYIAASVVNFCRRTIHLMSYSLAH